MLLVAHFGSVCQTVVEWLKQSLFLIKNLLPNIRSPRRLLYSRMYLWYIEFLASSAAMILSRLSKANWTLYIHRNHASGIVTLKSCTAHHHGWAQETVIQSSALYRRSNWLAIKRLIRYKLMAVAPNVASMTVSVIFHSDRTKNCHTNILKRAYTIRTYVHRFKNARHQLD